MVAEAAARAVTTGPPALRAWPSLRAVLTDTVQPGAHVTTDGWKGYPPATRGLYTHTAHSIRASGLHAHVLLPGVHRVASLLKRWMLGTHQGSVGTDHLDAYLAERVFGPLGMRDTRYNPPASERARIAPTEFDPWRQRQLRGEVHDENAFALGGVSGAQPDPDDLTAREIQILVLVSRGMSNREIGAQLFISEHTAANHVRSILRKTRSANRTEAAAYAHRRGLVRP